MNQTNNYKVVIISALLSIALSSNLFAAKREGLEFPIGCHDVGYNMNLKILKLLPNVDEKPNSMYFVYNKLPESVSLYHMHNEGDHFSVYLNHRIYSNKWAVFTTNEKELKFICTVKDRRMDYGKIVDCSKALAVCEYPKVKFGLNNRGNHWIVSSTTKNGAVRGVVRFGIIPAY